MLSGAAETIFTAVADRRSSMTISVDGRIMTAN